jgi:serine/threonine protein kinase/Tfp pilus assembly protein PilF
MALDSQHVKSLFLAAVDRPVEERAAFLDEACAGEDELRRRVEQLLEAHDRPDSLPEAPPAAGATRVADPEEGSDPGWSAEGPGAVIGPYKLLQQLGEGGMGAVFMAEQRAPVRRMVALKIIKPGLDYGQVIARFEAERQALALMDHPNIARVLDGGATQSGRPFFVMELVKGAPITRFCDEHRLTPRQRLELFVGVCQAVQHAHQKGIIHRDIKPSNVLVCLYDGRPVPKVIDFGVAKAMGQQLTERTLFTEIGQVVGTLEYMSPEQAELNQLDIDTRSDVYSLGVLLYELLTGSTPLERKRLKSAGMLEVLRLIREEEPPRPSTRLSEAKDTLPAISAQRQMEPARLAKLVRGELDWIVMKALEKNRSRRYESANGLAQDVSRYLNDEPVLACPPSAAYRLSKFVRRHKGAVLAASVFVLLLTAGVVGTTIGLVRALAAERQTSRERDEKEEARRLARQALNTLTDDVVAELLATQVQLTDRYREFLKKVLAHHEAFAAAGGDAPEDRRSRADGFFRVGRIRYSLGELKEAEKAYLDALSLQRQLVEDFPDRPELRSELAESLHGLAVLLGDLSRSREAEKTFREVLDLRKQLAEEANSPEAWNDLAKAHANLGALLHLTNRPREAERCYRDDVETCKKLIKEFGPQPDFRRSLAVGNYNLGLLLYQGDRLHEAETPLRESLRLSRELGREDLRPTNRLDLAKSHMTRAVLLQVTSQPRQAALAWNDAIAVGKKLSAEFPARPDFRNELALSYNNLGMLLRNSRRLSEAEEAWQAALALYKQLAADLPVRAAFRSGVVMSHHNLGLLAHEMKRPDQSEASFREAITAGQALVADFPRRTEFLHQLALGYDHLGHLLLDHQRPGESEPLLREALRLWTELAKALPERTGYRGKSVLARYDLHRALKMMGRTKDAGAELVEVMRIEKEPAMAHFVLARLLKEAHRPDEAINQYRKVIELQKDFPEAKVNLGNLLADKGQLDAAIDLYHQAIETKRDFPQIANAHRMLGNALQAQGRPAEALVEFRRAVALDERFAGAHYAIGNALFPDRPAEAVKEYRRAIALDPDYAQARVNLGNSLGRLEKMEEAITEYKAALVCKQRDFTESYKAHHGLGNALQAQGKLDEAIEEYREALWLKSDSRTHYSLAVTLQKRGDFLNAATEFRKAIELEPSFPEAHCDLGLLLQQQGEFTKALTALRRGHRIGARRPAWQKEISAHLVSRCERLVELDATLPQFLEDKVKPANPGESVELAELCSIKHLHRAAARFWEQAFAGKPRLAEDPRNGNRYNAACAAALAGCGKGKDADKLDEMERGRLRRQALDWLRADLKSWGRLLEKEPATVRPMLAGQLRHWQQDADLAGVRGPEALARLPESERPAWRKLWADVAELLARARE